MIVLMANHMLRPVGGYPQVEAWRHSGGWYRQVINDRAREDLGWRPRYDFSYVLDRLAAGDDPRSRLSLAVGSKGYHAHKSVEGPYPVE